MKIAKGTCETCFHKKIRVQRLFQFNFELIFNTLGVVSWLESIEGGLVLDQLALVLL